MIICKPICCHAYRVNCLWQQTENRQGDRLTIETQTFLLFVKNQAKDHEDPAKNPAVGKSCVIEKNRSLTKNNNNYVVTPIG